MMKTMQAQELKAKEKLSGVEAYSVSLEEHERVVSGIKQEHAAYL
jgi:hypothetical protein